MAAALEAASVRNVLVIAASVVVAPLLHFKSDPIRADGSAECVCGYEDRYVVETCPKLVARAIVGGGVRRVKSAQDNEERSLLVDRKVLAGRVGGAVERVGQRRRIHFRVRHLIQLRLDLATRRRVQRQWRAA